MKAMRWIGMVAAAAAIGGGVYALAPSVSGQSVERRPRALTVLAGRGGQLGVQIKDADAGVEVEQVEPDSAAEKAGIKRGDVIVEFDGEHVRSGRQFARLVQETAPGKTVKATILRDGRRQDVQVAPTDGRASTVIINGDRLDPDRLRERFGDLGQNFREYLRPFNFNFDDRGFRFDDMPSISGARLGVRVDELTTQLARYFGAKDGVLVTSVTDGSAASAAGLKAGDVITSINGRSVASRDDLVRALRDADGGDVTIGIVRDKKEMSVKAKLNPSSR